MKIYMIVLMIEGILLIVSLFLLVYLVRKSHVRKKENSLAKNHARERELDAALLNPIATENSRKAKRSNNVAYDVQYHEQKGMSGSNVLTVQLEVHSPLAVRKHLVQITDSIDIGYGKSNEIDVNDMEVAEKHCCLICEKKHLYLQRISKDGYIELKRKRTIYGVGENPPEIKAGDKILLGNTYIEILSIR